MNDFFAIIMDHVNYLASVTLFVIGLFIVIKSPNLLKKLIGLNIMETSVFLFFVTIGHIIGAKAPIILNEGEEVYINPVPSALILTGIVVGISVSAYALSLIVAIYKEYRTINLDEIMLAETGGDND